MIAQREDEFLAVVNIHNFDLSDEEIRRVGIQVQDFREDAEQRSTQRSVVFLTGDFNFPAVGESYIRMDNSNARLRDTVQRSSDSTQKKWSSVTRGLIECEQYDPTRIGMRTVGNHQYLTASRIDRIYCSIPAWKMLCLGACTHTHI